MFEENIFEFENYEPDPNELEKELKINTEAMEKTYEEYIKPAIEGYKLLVRRAEQIEEYREYHNMIKHNTICEKVLAIV